MPPTTMHSTPPSARAWSSPPKSAVLAGGSGVDLRQRAHEPLERPEPLVGGELQVLAEQTAVDVLLVGLRHWIGSEVGPPRRRALTHGRNVACSYCHEHSRHPLRRPPQKRPGAHSR